MTKYTDLLLRKNTRSSNETHKSTFGVVFPHHLSGHSGLVTPLSTTVVCGGVLMTGCAILTLSLSTCTRRCRGLGKGSWDNGLRDVKIITEEHNTIISQIIVVKLPAELFGNVATGLEGLHDVHGFKISDWDLWMLCQTSVFLNDGNTLLEKICVCCLDIALFNDHHFRG